MSKKPNSKWQRFGKAAGLRFTGKDVLLAVVMYLVAVMGCLLLRSFDPHNDTRMWPWSSCWTCS